MMKRGIIILLCCAMLSIWGWAKMPEAMLVLDASGSMMGQIGGESKIASAQRVFAEVVPTFPKETPLGLVVYGHRAKKKCDDIELLHPLGLNNRDVLLQSAKTIKPLGMTPISDAIAKALGSFSKDATQHIVVLLSDGIETCKADPCAFVRTLKDADAKLILYIVGFGVKADESASLRCMAEAGGGEYFDARDASKLLEAFQTIGQKVEVAVEEAKTVTKKVATGLGKLHILLPKEAAISLADIKLIRASDDKLIKTAEQPDADATYPLPSGEYRIVLGFANPNYQPPTDVTLGSYTVEPKMTTEVRLGALAYNIAPALQKLPAAAVTVASSGNSFALELQSHNNGYYLFKPKPLPIGEYQVGILYSQSKTPMLFTAPVQIEEAHTTYVTIDSGFKIIKPSQGDDVQRWELVEGNGGKSVLGVERRWDNQYPLWESFAVSPGRYSVRFFLKGMPEPLDAGELEIKKGELVEFESGL